MALYTRVLEYMAAGLGVKAGLSHTHVLIQPVFIRYWCFVSAPRISSSARGSLFSQEKIEGFNVPAV